MSKKSQLIILCEVTMPEVPAHLVRDRYGAESIVNLKNGEILAEGTSMFIEGPIEEIRAWIKSAGGKVWTSNNPMLGNWELNEL